VKGSQVHHFTKTPQSKQSGHYKNRDLLNLLFQSWICEQRMLNVTMVSCLLSYIFSGNANRVTRLYLAWRFDDRFFALNCCV